MSRNHAQQNLAQAAASLAKPPPMSDADIADIQAREAEEAKREAAERAFALEASRAAGHTDTDLVEKLQQTVDTNRAKAAETTARAETTKAAEPAVPPGNPPKAADQGRPAPLPFTVRGGRVRKPRRTVIFGEGGCGKTTLVADIADSLFVDINNGSESLDVQRYIFRPEDELRGHVPKTWEEVRQMNKTLRETKHPYKAVIYDLLGDLEHLALKFIVKRDSPQDGKTKGKSLESYGYGAGKQVLLDEMRVLFDEMNLLIARGIDVVIVAHSTTIKYNNPSGPDYDRHVFQCSPLVGPYLYGWADEVGFLHFDDQAVKAEGKRGKNKGITTGRRILEFDHSAAWDAKARLPFPKSIQIPSANPWQFYREALHRAYAMTAADLRQEIANELERIGDPELNPKVDAAVKAVGDNKDKLTAYMQDLRRRPALEKEETQEAAGQADDE